MQHFGHIVVHFDRVALELLQQQRQSSHDFYVGESSNETLLSIARHYFVYNIFCCVQC